MMGRLLMTALGTVSLAACVPLDSHLDPKAGTAKDANAPDLDIRDATVTTHDAGMTPLMAIDASTSTLDASAEDAGAVASRNCQADEADCPSAACRFMVSIGRCGTIAEFYTLAFSAVDGGSTGTLPDIQSYSWQLADKPDGSQASVADNVNPRGNMVGVVPDVPGTYRLCVQASTDEFDSAPGCCTLTMPRFAYTFDPAGSSITLEDIELNGGKYTFSFSSNQRVSLKTGSTVAINDVQRPTDWRGEGYFGDGGFTFTGLLHFDGDVLPNLKDTLHVGDTLSMTATVKADVYCHDAEITQEMTLIAEPEAPADAPIITDVVFADAASQQSLYNVPIRVRFAAERPAGTRIFIGGWWVQQYVDAGLRDDGVAPDDIAGDGWYSGWHAPLQMPVVRSGGLLPARLGRGSYDVLMQAAKESENGFTRGSSFRKTLVIDTDLPDAGP